MKVVFVAYHDLLTEARSQDTLKALEKIGSVTVVSQKELPNWSCSENVVVPYENQVEGLRYIKFLSAAKRIIKFQKPDMVLLHDAVLLIPFIKKVCPNCCIVCDQSELMIDRKNTNIKLLILNIIDAFSKAQLKRADLVICANEERAIISQYYYNLPQKPYVFENIHRIDDKCDDEVLCKKYSTYLNSKDKIVVYGGGISKARKTYDLIRSAASIKGVRIILAGASPEGLSEYHRLIDELNVKDRVDFVGFVPRSEWRFILRIADISFVAFEKNCWNSIYCASGKAFESLFEGTPVLCSDNPPLQRLCSEKKVGIATNNITNGIQLMLEDIDTYKKNALTYAATLDYESRISDLSNHIRGVYNG